MNIFVLDDDIERCARSHCDQHVVKMILESVQLLCTALNKKGFDTPYRSTHLKHPCVLWVEESYDNFCWLRDLAVALNDEYRFRYGKPQDHKSMATLSLIESMPFARRGLTPFAQAMPEPFKVQGNAVLAYRRFYVQDKSRFARWTVRPQPDWYTQMLNAATD
ncbi:pyrimidine dimer DNA glycosylase/endonuclease V [Ferrimonas sp. SCSIO 43195]|uniref:pyrimidine dimer DNA glycosylase/endonuclease V n=1 Tax=Ferrimonas sp. SCSIO 43195 TaxID=2822844 RepID=UPI0020758A55|nr:pyrimidine dimer DNA glycosylase/endonuclease V [Ferrimonas sp. SCSIO 43195]USD36175.1 hypothetical protein J8Z22_14160 [Ferrimonas sp. SCSIO 43195]